MKQNTLKYFIFHFRKLFAPKKKDAKTFLMFALPTIVVKNPKSMRMKNKPNFFTSIQR